MSSLSDSYQFAPDIPQVFSSHGGIPSGQGILKMDKEEYVFEPEIVNLQSQVKNLTAIYYDQEIKIQNIAGENHVLRNNIIDLNNQLKNTTLETEFYKHNCSFLEAKAQQQWDEIKKLKEELWKMHGGYIGFPSSTSSSDSDKPFSISPFSSSDCKTIPTLSPNDLTVSETFLEDFFHEEQEVVKPPIPKSPRELTFESFGTAVIFWRNNFEESPLATYNLDISCYLFNPSGEQVVPQFVKSARNPCCFYMNQRGPKNKNSIAWTNLDENDKNQWKEHWRSMRVIQTEQMRWGLIVFKVSKKSKGRNDPVEEENEEE